MMAKRAYTTSDHNTTVICQQCNGSKTVDVSKLFYTNGNLRIKATCSCGHAWALELEKRRMYRKTVNLSGTYEHIKGKKVIGRGTVKIVDLCLNGAKIKLDVERDFQVGDQLDIEFDLDDSLQTNQKKRATVRNINGPYIGSSFRSEETSDPVLGFYLLTDAPTVRDRGVDDDRIRRVECQEKSTHLPITSDEKKRVTIPSPERKIEKIDGPEDCPDYFEKSPDEFVEKRKHPRLEFHCTAMAFGREVFVKDISQEGLFIGMEEIPNFRKIGRVVNLDLYLPTEVEKLSLKVKVVSQNEKGFGCKYFNIDRDNRMAINNCFEEFKNTLPAREPD